MNDKQLNLFELDDEHSIYALLNEEFLPREYFEIEYKSGKDRITSYNVCYTKLLRTG